MRHAAADVPSRTNLERLSLCLYCWNHLWLQLLCGGAGVHERQLCHAASCLSKRANLEWLGLRLHCRRPMWLDLLRRRNRLHGW
jgi:hypothetical protein